MSFATFLRQKKKKNQVYFNPLRTHDPSIPYHNRRRKGTCFIFVVFNSLEKLICSILRAISSICTNTWPMANNKIRRIDLLTDPIRLGMYAYTCTCTYNPWKQGCHLDWTIQTAERTFYTWFYIDLWRVERERRDSRITKPHPFVWILKLDYRIITLKQEWKMVAN